MEVQINDFSCETCLSQNDTTPKQPRDHENIAKNCLTCLGQIPEKGMSNDVKSRKHEVESLKNKSVLLDTKLGGTLDLQKRKCSIPELDVPEQIRTITPIPEAKDESAKCGKHNILDPKASKYKTNENNDLCTANNELSNKYILLTEYGALANILMDVLTPSFCYVCNVEISKMNNTKSRGNHYNCLKHYQTLDKWINNFAKKSGFCVKDMDDLICFACHAIFPKKRYAEIHYVSSGHLSQIRKFCNVCLQRLVGREAVDHYKDPHHKTQETVRNMEKERNVKISMAENQPINPTFTEIFLLKSRSINNLQIHGINVDIIRALIQDKLDETVQCDPIPKSLIELMTPTYCFLCNQSALRNNRGNFRHYTYQSHQKQLKQFLHNKENSGQINYESVYCEPCQTVFLNNELAAEHYNTAEHKEICAPCGTKRSDIYRSKLQSINDPIGIMIADKLNDLISPTFCFVCQSYVNMHLPNHHYLERDHTIKLRSWLDNQIKKSSIEIDTHVLYCEYCALALGGTHEDIKHYETASHQLNMEQYCSNCMFRGTPNEVFEHISSKEHKDKSMDNLQEKGSDSLWPEELTKLMTLNECKVCLEKLVTKLYDHGKFHSSTWSGPNPKSPNGHDSSSTTPMSNNGKETSKPQEKMPEEVTIDEPISPTQSVPHQSEGQLVSLAQLPPGKIDDNNVEYTKHYEEIAIEMNKLINTVYFLKPLPVEQSIGLLKELNDKLTTYKSATNEVKQTCESFKDPCENNKPPSEADNENIGETKEIIPTSPRTSYYNDEIIELQFLQGLPHCVPQVTEREYAKTKLSMEMHRLKMVITSNTSKIPSLLAFEFIQNLNQLLEGLVNDDSKEFDIDSIFESSKNKFMSLEKTSNTPHPRDSIQDELGKLSTTLLDVKKISVELALDFITRFNIKLENFLQYQEDNYLYLPDSLT